MPSLARSGPVVYEEERGLVRASADHSGRFTLQRLRQCCAAWCLYLCGTGDCIAMCILVGVHGLLEAERQ